VCMFDVVRCERTWLSRKKISKKATQVSRLMVARRMNEVNGARVGARVRDGERTPTEYAARGMVRARRCARIRGGAVR